MERPQEVLGERWSVSCRGTHYPCDVAICHPPGGACKSRGSDDFDVGTDPRRVGLLMVVARRVGQSHRRAVSGKRASPVALDGGCKERVEQFRAERRVRASADHRGPVVVAQDGVPDERRSCRDVGELDERKPSTLVGREGDREAKWILAVGASRSQKGGQAPDRSHPDRNHDEHRGGHRDERLDRCSRMFGSSPTTASTAVTAPSNRYIVAVEAVISPRRMMSKSARRDLASSVLWSRVRDFGATGPS